MMDPDHGEALPEHDLPEHGLCYDDNLRALRVL